MLYRATLTELAPSENTTTDAHLVVTVKGEQSGTFQRPNLGLIPVVDRSGSMASQDKLLIATRALEYLSGYLDDADQVALVAFDSYADTLLHPVRCDSAGAAAFTAALRQVHAAASTNLEGGLRHGLAAAATMPADTLVRLVVLTDGQANCGQTHPEQLKALLADIPPNVSVTFLGVGRDCDHDLLGTLAAAGRGNYGFIEAAERAADVLGTEVGGLLDIEARDVRVTVTGRGKYLRLDTPLGLDSAAGTNDGSLSVRLGSLIAGQSKHAVFRVQLLGPKRRHARPITVADVQVTAVLDGQERQQTLLPKVHFGGPQCDPDDDVLAAVDLAVVAQAQREAEQQARAGNFAAARDVFDSLDLVTGAAATLSRGLASSYNSHTVYAASSTLRSSSSHALSGSLSGSDTAFDALAARSIGTYTTAWQRDVAAQAAAAAVPARDTTAGALHDIRTVPSGTAPFIPAGTVTRSMTVPELTVSLLGCSTGTVPGSAGGAEGETGDAGTVPSGALDAGEVDGAAGGSR